MFVSLIVGKDKDTPPRLVKYGSNLWRSIWGFGYKLWVRLSIYQMKMMSLKGRWLGSEGGGRRRGLFFIVKNFLFSSIRMGSRVDFFSHQVLPSTNKSANIPMIWWQYPFVQKIYVSCLLLAGLKYHWNILFKIVNLYLI